MPAAAAGPWRRLRALLLAAVGVLVCVPVLSTAEPCLADAAPAQHRSLISVKGQKIPIGFWTFRWPSAWLTNYVVQIIVEEVLGLQTNTTGWGDYGIDGLFALAGCTLPSAPDQTSTSKGCKEDPFFVHHVALEVWRENNFDIVNQALVRWPNIRPQNLGGMGYLGVEGMYVFGSERMRAYDAESLALEYYRSYNGSRQRPSTYFERHYAISESFLLPCDNLTLTNNFSRYLSLTGDRAGVRLTKNGTYMSSCWNASWWLSPACRDSPDTCVPVITSGAGWYMEEMMQKSFFHNLPLALASGVSMQAYVDLGTRRRVLVYWYEPSSSFISRSPVPIVFPPYDAVQREHGRLTSQADRIWLGKGVSTVLGAAAPPLQGLLSRVSFTSDDLLAMFFNASEMGCTDASPECYRSVACAWVQEYRATWTSWTKTVCSLGSGPLDERRVFVSAVSGAESGGCSVCPAGCFSSLSGATETGYVCSQCPPGRSSSQMGVTACEACPAGRFTNDLVGVCTSFRAPGSGPCQPCDYGQYSSTPGSTGCDQCPAGTSQNSLGQTSCEPCEWGMVALPGSEVCEPCYVCLSNSRLMGELLLIFVLLVAVLSLLLQVAGVPPRLGYRICIWDLQGRSPGTTIRCGGHFLRGSVPVRFSHTKVPALDAAASRWRVHISATGDMQLQDAAGQSVCDPALQTSVGFLHVRAWHAALHGWPLGVPLLPLTAGLMAAVALCVWDAEPGNGRRGSAVQDEDDRVHALLAADAVGALMLAAGLTLWHRRRMERTVPLERLVRNFRLHLRGSNPRPAPCERGAGRAVAMQDLDDFFFRFQGYIRDRDMYYVVGNVVLPLTAQYRLSYAEVVGPKMVTWFVSHFWGTSFRGFLCSLQKHAQQVCESAGPAASRTKLRDASQETYWVCSFSNNQWRLAEELGGGAKSSSFYVCMQSGSCKGTALVLDSQAMPLTRSWCLFEMLQTMALEKQPGFTGLWLCTETGTLNRGNASVELAVRIGNAVSSLRLEHAEASREEDKDMIDSEVASMPGGFSSMNAFLRGNLREALMGMKDTFDSEIQASITRLGASTSRDEVQAVGAFVAKRFSQCSRVESMNAACTVEILDS